MTSESRMSATSAKREPGCFRLACGGDGGAGGDVEVEGLAARCGEGASGTVFLALILHVGCASGTGGAGAADCKLFVIMRWRVSDRWPPSNAPLSASMEK